MNQPVKKSANAGEQKDRRALRLQQAFTLVLVLMLIAVLAGLSLRFNYEADWTAQNRNSLTQASIRLLEGLPGDIQVTAFVVPNADMHREIKAFFARYRRIKSNIGLTFIDPQKKPAKARELGISSNGEVVIEYDGRRENLPLAQVTESSVSAALQRLGHNKNTRIAFLAGHGERRLDSNDQTEYSILARELNDRGLNVEILNLAGRPDIPSEISLLVIASPQKKPLPGEVEIITRYIESGGNLLWMTDPDTSQNIPALSTLLDVQWQKGTLVYPDFELLGTGHPAIALVAEYGGHPITRDLTDITIFPFSGVVFGAANSSWQHYPFLASPERSWLETGSVDGDFGLDDDQGDLRGPLPIGLAMEKPINKDAADTNKPELSQRIVVMGDSDFMANGYLNNIANLQFSLNLFQWLTHRDAQISVDVPPAADTDLRLSPTASATMIAVFVVILPLLFLLMGLRVWWTRRNR